MRFFVKILSFLMLLILLSAEECSDKSSSGFKEKSDNEIFQNIENDFSEVELARPNLTAFEKRAVQKLQDISDYISIYADKSLPVQFRIQARQMIYESFADYACVKNYFKHFELCEDTLNNIVYRTDDLKTFKTAIDSILITNRLSPKSASDYSGEVQFNQTIFSIDSGRVVNSKTSTCRLNIVAIKAGKEFGDKTEEVWEVYLGSISN